MSTLAQPGQYSAHAAEVLKNLNVYQFTNRGFCLRYYTLLGS